MKKSKFVVLDCGGGTVDITAHEILSISPSLSMASIAIPTGGNWGGEYVNHEFRKFLQEFLGTDLFKEHVMPYEYHKLFNEFDRIKVNFEPTQDPAVLSLRDILDDVTRLPELCEKYNTLNPSKLLYITPRVRNGFLAMSKALMMSFFEPMLISTRNEARKVLERNPDVSYFMVVGGFGSSKTLGEFIRKEFDSEKVRVIVPTTNPRPQAAIMHGAVYYGLYKVIISRIASQTYGVYFHPDIFKVLVTIGESLPVDHEVTIEGYPVTPDQDSCSWTMVKSCKALPEKASEETCLGKVVAHCPKHTDKSKRKQIGRFKFGGTEIRVEIINAEGEVSKGEVSMK